MDDPLNFMQLSKIMVLLLPMVVFDFSTQKKERYKKDGGNHD
jgi:hypothetical protein